MVQQPEVLNKHYYDVFVKTLRANIPEYDKIEKRLISPGGTVEPILAFDPAGRLVVGTPPMVGEHGDYLHFRGNLAVDKVDPEVEGVVRLLAEREAATVETLIGHTQLHRTPVCYDLFRLSDGAPNLKTYYCVKGNESTKDDPTGSITGWFAYKLFFTVSTKQP